MSTHPITVVFQKELTDALRDRRMLGSSFLYPLIGPLLMLLLFSVLGRVTAQQTEKPLVLPVSGAENAPNLVAFLRQQGTEIVPAPADPERAVRAGDLEVVLIIPPEFGADFSAGRPATVQLVLDNSRQSASVTNQRAQRLLRAYGQQIGAVRLLARGVSPDAAQAVSVAVVDVATPQSQAAMFLNILPYFMIFAVFTGGMGVTIDSTAGERERQTLEPLVINPVPRWQLVVGKLLVALVFTVMAVIESLLGFAVMLRVMPLDYLSANVQLPPASLVGIFLINVPLMFVGIALQFIIASFTRSFKEAQNYLSFLPLLPALPGMVLAFIPLRPAVWHMLIPTFGQQLLINQVLRGETLLPLHLVVASAVSLALAVVLLAIAARLFEREHVLFAR